MRDGADVVEFHLNIMRHFSGMLIYQGTDFLPAVGKRMLGDFSIFVPDSKLHALAIFKGLSQ